LTTDQQQHLAKQILAIDFELYEQLAHASFAEGDEEREQTALASAATVPPAMRLDGSGVPFSVDAAMAAGEEALARGEVGMIIVAGGLGTRLGFDKPKGMLPLGPLSGRTLFQIFCEYLLALERRYQKPVPLYVMTSPATHAATEQFLQANHYFGLAGENVRLFCQAMLWAFDAQSKRLLLESPGSIFSGPDGHGGMLQAFATSGGLANAQARGLKVLSYGQIDNPLTSICEPRMLGSHLLAKSEMTPQNLHLRNPNP
jgi:UDP-N-acetylglucosamine/UDP-N-acetylgalactosamine diphosphorylase